MSVTIPGDGEGGDIDFDESLKKNVDQNHIIHENFLTPWGQKFGRRASEKMAAVNDSNS